MKTQRFLWDLYEQPHFHSGEWGSLTTHPFGFHQAPKQLQELKAKQAVALQTWKISLQNTAGYPPHPGTLGGNTNTPSVKMSPRLQKAPDIVKHVHFKIKLLLLRLDFTALTLALHTETAVD